MEFKDYYEVLGVGKDATADDIKRAYRRLARAHHPDLNPGDHAAEARFKELNEAHEVLSNPESRRKYDALGANWRYYEQAPDGWPGPFGSGPSSQRRWHVNPGSSREGHAFSDEQFGDIFSKGGFSDFFQTFFGSQGSGPGHRHTQRTRDHDVEYRLELTLEEAFTGVTRRVTLPAAPGRPARTVDVKIPSGVKTGSRIRISGDKQTSAKSGGGDSADVFLRIELRPHSVFTLKGDNLYVPVAVPIPTAVLGGHVEVPTPGGTTLRLKVPPGTQPGQVFRIREKGLPGLRRHTKRGDLYATARLTVPQNPSPAARRHYEALADLEPGSTRSYTKVEP